MNFLSEIVKNRAAKRYARRLPGALRKGWGRTVSYTSGQIEAAARNEKLDLRFIVFGYAMFLSEDAFAEMYRENTPLLSYENARATFLRFLPFSSSAGWGDVPSRALEYAEGGQASLGGPHSHHH